MEGEIESRREHASRTIRTPRPSARFIVPAEDEALRRPRASGRCGRGRNGAAARRRRHRSRSWCRSGSPGRRHQRRHKRTDLRLHAAVQRRRGSDQHGHDRRRQGGWPRRQQPHAPATNGLRSRLLRGDRRHACSVAPTRASGHTQEQWRTSWPVRGTCVGRNCWSRTRRARLDSGSRTWSSSWCRCAPRSSASRWSSSASSSAPARSSHGAAVGDVGRARRSIRGAPGLHRRHAGVRCVRARCSCPSRSLPGCFVIQLVMGFARSTAWIASQGYVSHLGTGAERAAAHGATQLRLERGNPGRATGDRRRGAGPWLPGRLLRRCRPWPACMS